MKARLKFVVEVEYEIKPEYYDGCTTPEEMLAVDIEGAKGDPFLTLDNDSAKWTITGEIVE